MAKENNDMRVELGQIKRNEEELENATQRIMGMIKDHEKANETIEDQYRTIEDNKDEMEKLKLEVTVIMTEKG